MPWACHWISVRVAGVLEKLEEEREAQKRYWEELEKEREAQKRYWEEQSRDLTVEAMMPDSRVVDLGKEERPEILSLLPDYEGKSVLKLGAGIGCFTGELTKKAGHVLAINYS